MTTFASFASGFLVAMGEPGDRYLNFLLCSLRWEDLVEDIVDFASTTNTDYETDLENCMFKFLVTCTNIKDKVTNCAATLGKLKQFFTLLQSTTLDQLVTRFTANQTIILNYVSQILSGYLALHYNKVGLNFGLICVILVMTI
eukprot:TRINITY_DN5309_c0_g1_i22.p2 TRINITY_DN5309_c0_g1~~TRINITY_DN5309_c0_g1_i22.p2  ORF type:complete len:143 (-),score=25.89 TRINITY_DN5309_c0_g1_i22:188-616(-)